jgi:hypothetical protein
MGQNGPNLVNVQNRHGSLYYRMLDQVDDSTVAQKHLRVRSGRL